jgi:hypothetical protein
VIGQQLQSIFTQTGGSEPKAAEPNHCSDALDGSANFEPFFSHSHRTTSLPTHPVYTDTDAPFCTHAAHASATTLRKSQPWRLGSGVRHVFECVGARCPHAPSHEYLTNANQRATDDEEEDSSSPSSPVVKPIARRSKFDDEEEDSDVRQPTLPRRCTTLCPAMHKYIHTVVLTNNPRS